MPFYDYTCGNGHTTEKRAGMDVVSILCPDCGGLAHRESVYLPYLVTETGTKDFRKAEVPRDERRHDKDYKRFQEAGAELDYQHTKRESEAGVEIPQPSLWKESIRRAKRIKAGLEAPLKVS